MQGNIAVNITLVFLPWYNILIIQQDMQYMFLFRAEEKINEVFHKDSYFNSEDVRC